MERSVLGDDLLLEILSLYQQGLEASEIAIALYVPTWCVRDALEADAEEFPHDPLRVLH